jgi:Tetrahydrofolate dehydrogenase/cyclohydrolase, NAD(P)-binding domain
VADVRQITSTQPNGEHPRLLLRLQGCLELLDRSGVQLSGKRAVVVGRSNIVGTPVAQLLQVCSLLLQATVCIGLSVLPHCQ